MLQAAQQLPMNVPIDDLATVVEQALSGELAAFNTLFAQYNARICTYLAFWDKVRAC